MGKATDACGWAYGTILVANTCRKRAGTTELPGTRWFCVGDRTSFPGISVPRCIF